MHPWVHADADENIFIVQKSISYVVLTFLCPTLQFENYRIWKWFISMNLEKIEEFFAPKRCFLCCLDRNDNLFCNKQRKKNKEIAHRNHVDWPDVILNIHYFAPLCLTFGHAHTGWGARAKSCLHHFHCAPSETALAYTRPTRGEAEEPYYENLPEGPIRQKKL